MIEETKCPKCGGRMWDNRTTKINPKAPDFKCRDRQCGGVIWPPRAPVPLGFNTPEHAYDKTDDQAWQDAQRAEHKDQDELPFR